MLELKNISKYYDQHKGIAHLSVKVKKGSVLAFLGSNGSGKTTTFRILLGLLKPSEGTILYHKRAIREYPSTLMGYMPEERSLLRDLKVFEQIRYLARLKGMEDALIEVRMRKWLEGLGITHYRNRRIAELSKGNQQKVQLICALIHDPEIIIFDEPLNGLDLENVQLFQALITYLKKQQKIILLSSHQYESVEPYCDSVLYLYHGDVIFQGDLLRLKQQRQGRIMQFPKQCGRNWLDLKGVLDVHEENGYTTLRVDHERTAAMIMKELMRDDIYEIQVSLPSLRELIRGYMDERAH